jgi:hypothetical protein
MKNRSLLATFFICLLVMLSGCSAIAGIFKAGVWSGIIIVVIVIVLIIFIVGKMGKKG